MSFPKEWKIGLVSLIPKNGDPYDINNKRPITLLCTDLRILTAILANGFQQTVSKLIHEDQTGFIRNILHTIHALDLISKNAIETEKSLNLLLIDFRKAFDSVGHEYLTNLLKALNFPFNFNNFIQNMFKDIYIKLFK